MSTLLRLFMGLWNLIVGALADFVGWLRRPGNKLKLLCGLLAIMLAYKAVESRDRAQQIVVIRTQAAVAETRCTTDKGTLAFNAAGRQAALDAITLTLENKAKELKALQDLNTSLAAQNAVLAARAEKDHKAFMEEYAKRPTGCTAALKVLQQTCPTLGGY